MMKKTVSPKNTKQKKINTQKTPKELNETFFYDRKKLILLAVFNILLVAFIWNLTSCLILRGLANSNIMIVLLICVMSLALLALGGSLFIAIHPLRLALITNQGITIDHNEELKWDEIKLAKEIKPFFCHHAIALHTKEGVKHNLTFMQNMCKHNEFTPFSIPLYAMTKKDAQKIQKLIKQKCKYKK